MSSNINAAASQMNGNGGAHNKSIMGMTQTTHFSKTGGDGFDRQMSGGDLMSGESTIQHQQSTIFTPGQGNIV